jgi:hypothetical protein
LRADEARVSGYRERLAALGSGAKIGLAWRGGLMRTRQNVRSVPPEQLGPLLDGRGLRLVSLQHGADDAELARIGSIGARPIAHWPEVLRDPDETAALMTALDAVVTVCSSVVHLGGALGVRVVVLVPSSPEWRYLRAGERMPWYPAVELVRQASAGDWGPVVREAVRRIGVTSGPGSGGDRGMG